MDRRNALKNLFIASGSLVALPAWANAWNKESIQHTPTLSVAQQAVLRSVADTIIPAGNSIGALAVGVDVFLNKLFDTCYDKDVQLNIGQQLENLETSAQHTYGKSFDACDQQQRESLLLKLSSSDIKEEKDFFTLVKSETIRGFSTSKEVMVDHLHYKVVPGHYYGCVDVKA